MFDEVPKQKNSEGKKFLNHQTALAPVNKNVNYEKAHKPCERDNKKYLTAFNDKLILCNIVQHPKSLFPSSLNHQKSFSLSSSSSSSLSHILVLPLDIWYQTRSFLNIKDIIKTRRVCKSWKSLNFIQNFPDVIIRGQEIEFEPTKYVRISRFSSFMGARLRKVHLSGVYGNIINKILKENHESITHFHMVPNWLGQLNLNKKNSIIFPPPLNHLRQLTLKHIHFYTIKQFFIKIPNVEILKLLDVYCSDVHKNLNLDFSLVPKLKILEFKQRFCFSQNVSIKIFNFHILENLIICGNSFFQWHSIFSLCKNIDLGIIENKNILQNCLHLLCGFNLKIIQHLKQLYFTISNEKLKINFSCTEYQLYIENFYVKKYISEEENDHYETQQDPDSDDILFIDVSCILKHYYNYFLFSPQMELISKSEFECFSKIIPHEFKFRKENTKYYFV